jgi:hypothetical protein
MLSLYTALLGPAWTSLAPAVRRLHEGGVSARGVFRVRRGASRLARLIASILRMPRPGEGVRVALAVESTRGEERWTRAFDDHPLRTVQWRRGALLVEAMGLVQCLFRLRADSGALVFEQVGAALGFRGFTVPLPRFLAPFIEGRAEPHEDGVHVDVRIHAPGVGLLVAYDGHVTPAPSIPAVPEHAA